MLDTGKQLWVRFFNRIGIGSRIRVFSGCLYFLGPRPEKRHLRVFRYRAVNNNAKEKNERENYGKLGILEISA